MTDPRPDTESGLPGTMWRTWPTYGEEELSVATRVLRSGHVNYWTGDEGRSFEREYAAYVGQAHGIALMNGTVALEAALRAVGVGAGDEVVVPARTFIATASAVIACGAQPVVCDVDPVSGNASAETIERAVGPRTRAVIPVHIGGWPCDMSAITELATGRGLAVIEDCAQAHGATWAGKQVGSFGDVGAFSFCQDKIISTCGEGGMAVTDREPLWRRMWEYKDHGRGWDAVQEARARGGCTYQPVYETFGTNWRMTEVQAAVGRLQLRKLDRWVSERRANAASLDDLLGSIPGIRVTVPSRVAGHAYYRYYAYVDTDALRGGWSRDRILGEVSAAGVPCGSGVCPEIYLEAAFTSRGIAPSTRLPNARLLGETSLMFLVHPTVGAAEMCAVSDVVARVMKQAVR